MAYAVASRSRRRLPVLLANLLKRARYKLAGLVRERAGKKRSEDPNPNAHLLAIVRPNGL